MHAATYSPTLWPISAFGATPQDCHSCASAYSRANNAGWVIAVCPSCAGLLAPAGGGYSTSRRSTPEDGPQNVGAAIDRLAEHAARLVERSPHADVLRALTREHEGNADRRSRRRTSGGGAPGRATGAARSRRRARAHQRAAMAEGATPDLQRVGQIGEIDGSGRPSGRQALRRGLERGGSRRRAASSCRAARSPARAGASSTTTCAFVPPTPNELTPARRGARAATSRSSISRRTAVRDVEPGSALGVQAGRDARCCRESAALIRPATPAAASRWPMLVLTEPMRKSRCRPYPLVRNACVSKHQLNE